MKKIMETNTLLEHFIASRELSVYDCKALIIEDFSLQAEFFTSPPKWHLAHTSWFYETFLLRPFLKDYQCFNQTFDVLFNSYYNAVGEQFPRTQRGLLSRPSVDETMQYRRYIDKHMIRLLGDVTFPNWDIVVQRTQLGIAHEQQHQELFFTDLKYSLAINPLNPSYCTDEQYITENHKTSDYQITECNWKYFEGGLVEIGHVGDCFSFDNERPRHKVYLEPFVLADRLVTNAQYKQFIDDGGYQRAEFWLADGWTMVQQQGWSQPHYWREQDGKALEFTLYGLQERNAQQPVCHISGYEADAYARWAQAYLPTEAQWEWACRSQSLQPALQTARRFHPAPVKEKQNTDNSLLQLSNECWQWTSSAYTAYPGFTPAAGAIGEYNGKFMCNQWVLRGGSCVSSPGHVRPGYRNFFYPQDRWQFSGLRLAKNVN